MEVLQGEIRRNFKAQEMDDAKMLHRALSRLSYASTTEAGFLPACLLGGSWSSNKAQQKTP